MLGKPFRWWLILLLMGPVGALAFEIGEIQVSSSLNQLFDARISLPKLTPEELGNVSVKLAPQPIFKEFGLDRTATLTNLVFSVEYNPEGDVYVKVVSTQPIREPSLGLLLEFRWPRGKTYREFTVFLDPVKRLAKGSGDRMKTVLDEPGKTASADEALIPVPVASTGTAPESAPKTETSVKPAASTLPVVADSVPAPLAPPVVAESAPAPAAPLEPPARPTPTPPVVAESAPTPTPATPLKPPATPMPPVVAESATLLTPGSVGKTEVEKVYGPVKAGANLSKIALEVRPDPAVTQEQMKQALYKANPEAFSKAGGMYGLRIGSRLRVPTLREIADLTGSAAVRQLADAREVIQTPKDSTVDIPAPVTTVAEPNEPAPSVSTNATPTSTTAGGSASGAGTVVSINTTPATTIAPVAVASAPTMAQPTQSLPPSPLVTLPVPITPEKEQADKTYGPVKPGERLAKVALTVRPDPGVTQRQMMEALYKANPGAFSKAGGMDGLRVGSTLRIPTLREIADLTGSTIARQLAQAKGAMQLGMVTMTNHASSEATKVFPLLLPDSLDPMPVESRSLAEPPAPPLLEMNPATPLLFAATTEIVTSALKIPAFTIPAQIAPELMIAITPTSTESGKGKETAKNRRVSLAMMGEGRTPVSGRAKAHEVVLASTSASKEIPSLSGSLATKVATAAPTTAASDSGKKPANNKEANNKEKERHYGPVSANERLWDIAGKVRPDPNIGRDIMMKALFAVNPQAFANTSIDKMKEGAILRIPTVAEIAKYTDSKVAKQLLEQ